MANIASAEKRNRQRIKRRARNVSHTTKMRSFIKKLDKAIGDKNAKAAQAALKAAVPEIDRAAKHGVIKRTTASRKISRLTKAVSRLAAPAR